MPEAIRYVPTFPMFLPMSAEGAPDLVEIDGFLCLALFTDNAKVEEHHRRNVPAVKGWHVIRMTTFNSAYDLRIFLMINEEQFKQRNCHHIAIDALPGARPMHATIREILHYLKSI